MAQTKLTKSRTGRAIRVSNQTYNELSKRGNLTDSFDSVISDLLKKVKLQSSQVVDREQIATSHKPSSYGGE